MTADLWPNLKIPLPSIVRCARFSTALDGSYSTSLSFPYSFPHRGTNVVRVNLNLFSFSQ